MIETLDALLETVRSGVGAMIVVEGQTRRDDPWFYNRWFGDTGREIDFVHQDGHEQVKKAVAYLRQHAPGRPVFGLIDRDFTTRDETDVDDPLEQGIYRTAWYTLENYFLADIDVWMTLLETLTAGDPPAGWRTPEEVRAQIHDAYALSLPVAAWNRVVRDECMRTLPRKGLKFHTHHNAINDETLDALNQWGQERAAPVALRDGYRELLAELTTSPDRWPELVTGKAVFMRFAEKFPELRSDTKLRRLYMGQQPAPPPDLAAIVDEIRREAAKLRRPGT